MTDEEIPPPDCEECGCEMSVDTRASDLYSCRDCTGGCSCLQVAPCSHCMSCIDIEVHREDYRENELTRRRAECERGPSAAMNAKPVTPKYVVMCQGDWHNGLENL